MTREQAVAFFLFSVAAAGTPGPSNVLLTAVGANVGVLRGLPCLLGVGLGMAAMMFVVAFGLGGALLDNPAVLTGVRWCGAAVLCWLGWKIADQPSLSKLFVGASCTLCTDPAWVVSQRGL